MSLFKFKPPASCTSSHASKVLLAAICLMFVLPAWAQSHKDLSYLSHFKLAAFIFWASLSFGVIPSALCKAFNLSLVYNVALGFVLAGLIGWTCHTSLYSLTASSCMALSLLTGWTMASYLLKKISFLPLKSTASKSTT